MKNKSNSGKINEYLEYVSFIIAILWIISPIIEYLIKYTFRGMYWRLAIFFIGIIGIIGYVLFLTKNKGRKLSFKNFFPDILVITFILLGIISTIFSTNPQLSFWGESYRREGLLVYIMYAGILLFSSIIKDKSYIKKIAIINTIVALFITILPILGDKFTYLNFSNVYANPNHYGYFLMVSVMLSIFLFIDSSKYKKIVYGIIYIFLLYILIRNDTFGCYLSIIISLIVLLIYSLVKKYQRSSVISVIIIFILSSFIISYYDIKIGERLHNGEKTNIILNNFKVFFSDTSTILNNKSSSESLEKVGTGRGLLWKGAWNYTMEHPLIGGGMECLKKYFQENGIKYNDRPHNSVLQISAFFGIPGAIVFLTFIIYLALKCLKIIKNDSMKLMIYFTAMCYFISSIFGNSMFYTTPYFMILLGLLLGTYRNNEIKTK